MTWTPVTAEANRRVGRVNFMLRTVLVTAMAFAVEFLGNDLLHLTLLPHFQFVLQRILIFGLIGTFLLPTIDGRLLDAGLRPAYRYPSFAIWVLSMVLPSIWFRGWTIGFALFAILMIAGGSISSKPMIAEPAPTREGTGQHEAAVAHFTVAVRRSGSSSHSGEFRVDASTTTSLPKRFLVSQVGFLRSLVSLGCLWLPLIWLDGALGHGDGVWFVRLGYAILSLLWFYKFLGRLGDAGRLPRPLYGYLTICLVLLIEIIRSTKQNARFVKWHIPLIADATAKTAAWLRDLNGYELLGLFLLVQVPVVLLPGKGRKSKDVLEHQTEVGLKKRSRSVKVNDMALCGPLEFLRILIVITCFWIPLIYTDRLSGGGIGSWFARVGYAILIFFWLTFTQGRLEDAGWAHSEYPSQYALLVSVASLMPLAAHWVNGYGSLAIFFLIQTPTVFLRSKPADEQKTAPAT